MSKIVVAKLVRLGKDGDKFKKDLIAQVERETVKIDDNFIKEFNVNWKTTGRLYIVNDELTKERDSKFDVPNDELEQAKARYENLYGKAPNGKMKLETMLEKIKEKESE